MKKLLLVAVLSAGTIQMVANPVGLQKAKEIAAAYVKDGSAPALVKSFQGAQTRATGNDLVYVFSRGENQGFVFVSGDDCLPEVLGYTDNGDFVEADMPPALLDMMQGYAELIAQAQAEGASARAPQRINSEWTAVAPLTTSHWHQTWPYNNNCPMRIDDPNSRCLTGCTCTAASQVAYYWRKECNNRVQYDTPSYAFGGNMENTSTVKTVKGTPLKWELMLNSYSSSSPQETQQAVATLNNVIGVSLYQTYGSSTSGQIGDIPGVYKGQLGLEGTCWYKSGNSQSYWESLCYTEVSNARPIVYAGVHPSSGGHAIVLDGYDGNGKFHFNFGWGGQGDGYYTLDDETGINGFSSSQGMVFKVRPAKYKVTAQILDDPLIYGTTSQVRIKLTNSGTLPYTGVKMCYTTSKKTNFTASDFKEVNNESIVPVDGVNVVTLSFKPSLRKGYYIYIADDNNRVIAETFREIIENDPVLTMKGVKSNLASTVTQKEGMDCQVLYGSQFIMKAMLANAEGELPTQPTVYMDLYKYNTDTKEFDRVRSANTVGSVIESGQTSDVSYSFTTKMEEGEVYRAILRPQFKVGTLLFNYAQAADSVLTFTPSAATLTVNETLSTETTKVLEGDWEPARFGEFASDPNVAVYDLTRVAGVADGLMAANPNALFYVADDAQPTSPAVNVIRQGVCQQLYLVQGYNFAPVAPFTAVNALFQHNAQPGHWHSMVLPFDAAVPANYAVRQLDGYAKNQFNAATVVNTLSACTPYVFLTDHLAANTISAQNVTVTTDKASLAADILKGAFTAQALPAKSYLLDDEKNKFDKVDEGTLATPFTAYVQYDEGSTLGLYFRMATATDGKYKLLCEAIAEAYYVLNLYGAQASDYNRTALQDALTAADAQLCSLKGEADNVTASSISAMDEELRNLTLLLYESARINTADAEHPADVTGFLVNPSFENSASVASGWTTGQTAAIRSASVLSNYTVGVDGKNIFVSKSNDNKGEGISQTVESILPGYYRLTAKVATEEGNDGILLTAGNKSALAQGTDFGTSYFTEVTVDSIQVMDGTLTIALQPVSGDWYKADDFCLYYLGCDDVTGITPVAQSAQSVSVRSSAGAIILESSSTQTVGIYMLNGVEVKQVKVDGTTIVPVPAGVYVVAGQKVLVK